MSKRIGNFANREAFELWKKNHTVKCTDGKVRTIEEIVNYLKVE